MKLFYMVNPKEYPRVMQAIREKFGMHQEVDEEKTILMLDGEDVIELVSGIYDPNHDEMAQIRVVLVDETLKKDFDAIIGKPYKVK
ncbi:MAG: hypothetical protein ACFFDP_11760 [Promethearchaeota archaeon]